MNFLNKGKELFKKAGDVLASQTEGILNVPTTGSPSLPKDIEIEGKQIQFLKLLDEGNFFN